MKRPIKFRGRICDENKARDDQGKLVYGNCLFQYPNGTVALSHTINLALTFVDPDSVAQLVGYDCDGKEVYEGDQLTDNRAEMYGDEVTAILQPYIRHESISQAEFYERFWSKPLVEDWQVKLKEAKQ